MGFRTPDPKFSRTGLDDGGFAVHSTFIKSQEPQGIVEIMK